ncbi:hypothetical protein [Sphingomonas sp. R1]|uniref:hypothetical protein n=1 Tax=Sphingomonas sp. R1 TaxID=399176 RepID=UPI0022253271|nr:hypothetical protein [Sphingomonas sp. R1]UYY77514.1 hypothetical protein OIM94_00425 [Sphingomonas sp. R1]
MKPPYSIVFDLDGYDRLIKWKRLHPERAKLIQDVALHYPRSRGEEFAVEVTTSDRTTALMLKLALA